MVQAPAPVAAPVEEVKVEPAYEPKPFEMSKKSSSAVVMKGLGMPKSKKPWKILSGRSIRHVKYNPKKWKQQMEEKKAMKALRDRIKEANELRKSEVRRGSTYDGVLFRKRT